MKRTSTLAGVFAAMSVSGAAFAQTAAPAEQPKKKSGKGKSNKRRRKASK